VEQLGDVRRELGWLTMATGFLEHLADSVEDRTFANDYDVRDIAQFDAIGARLNVQSEDQIAGDLVVLAGNGEAVVTEREQPSLSFHESLLPPMGWVRSNCSGSKNEDA
jgi:hypothetical protein